MGGGYDPRGEAMHAMVANSASEMIAPPFSSGRGLTTAEAIERLKHYGPNTAPEERRRPLLALLRKLWAPVPWMLEVILLRRMEGWAGWGPAICETGQHRQAAFGDPAQ
jgi:hypothetical protein